MSEKKQVDQNNLTIGINHKFFMFSLNELLKFIKTKSEKYCVFDNDSSLTKMQKAHSKLRKTCDDFIKGLTDETLDQGKIIKKIFKTISKNLDKLYPVLDAKLFSITNEEKKIVTIIPMIDIGLIILYLDELELIDLTNYLNMIYLSVNGMLFAINKKKLGEKTNYEILGKIKEQVLKSTIITEELLLYSSFLGGLADMGEFDMMKMFENMKEENIDAVSNVSGIKQIIKMTGIDKMLNFDDLNEQLQNVTEAEIEDATKGISKLFGGEGSTKISDTCSTIAKGFIGTLRTNKPKTLDGFIDTIMSSSSNLKVDTGDFEEMSSHLDKMTGSVDMMDNIKGMTDEKGNNIGEQMASMLEKPMQTLNNIKKGKMPNSGDLTDLLGDFMKMMKK